MLTKSYKTKIRIQHSVLFVVLLVIGLTMLVPFFWTLSSSLKYDREIFEYPIKWIPEVLRWSNYEEVWTRVNFLTYYLNTIKLSLIVTIGQVVTCSLAAYSFAKMDYPGRDKIFLCHGAFRGGKNRWLRGTENLFPDHYAHVQTRPGNTGGLYL